jgi:hypothetical protein
MPSLIELARALALSIGCIVIVTNLLMFMEFFFSLFSLNLRGYCSNKRKLDKASMKHDLNYVSLPITNNIFQKYYP